MTGLNTNHLIYNQFIPDCLVEKVFILTFSKSLYKIRQKAARPMAG
jgi:hypothetical protein